MSQEELAEHLNCSSRHIIRLENSQSSPSKAMVEAIANELSLGERDTNHLLVSAGFTPTIKPVDFDADEFRWLRKAMLLTLSALDPYPATLTDKSHNILMVNRGWVGFYRGVIPEGTLHSVSNHFDFLFSRLGADNLISARDDTLSLILMSLQQGVLMTGDEQAQETLDRLLENPNVPQDWQQRAAAIEPMASYRVKLEVNGQLRRFFNVSQTVGALGPNAFVSEPNLTVHTLYPEDETLDLSELIQGEIKHPKLFY